MTKQRKQQIALGLKKFCDVKGGQNKASNILNGVSSALISQVLNHNWDKISDEMWRNVEAQIGHPDNKWQIIETTDYRMFTSIMADAQENSQVYAVVNPAGSGKSVAMRNYELGNQNAYMMQCNEFWNRKSFLMELLRVMGRDNSGMNVNEMMVEIVNRLKKQEKPILLLDEFDKVSDQVLYFFITIYNQLEDHCAIVICSTDHLEKRMRKGLRLNRKGYNEIYSRIGRKFIELNGLTQQDVMQVCHVNGISDKAQMKEVWKDCEGDLRRVKRKVHALKLENAQNN